MKWNKIQLGGNVVKTPEIKTLSNSMKLAKLTLAVNSGYGNNEKTAYVDCEAWGKIADVVEKHVEKGKALFIEGQIKQDLWDDKETGKKRSSLFVTISELRMTSFKNKETDDTTDNSAEGEEQVPF